MLVLETMHGSRLYGFAHKDSDFDLYYVDADATKNKQSIVDDQDITVMGLASFVAQVGKGVPQAMEALYSPLKWVHPDYQGYFAGLEPDHNMLISTYRRTMFSFVNEGTVKHRRHAMRLATNLWEWWHTGSFNPFIDPLCTTALTLLAEHESTTKDFIQNMSPVEVWE